MSNQADPLARCPFCGSTNTNLHYLRTAEGYDPGCLSCEKSLPLDQWAARVLAV